MYQRRKKFTEEVSPEKRLSERWDQQVFYTKRMYPGSFAAIESIMDAHTASKAGGFAPTEEALTALANLCAELKTGA